MVSRHQAGQEGLEPPTRGFGVRCSTIRATALDCISLFGFLVTGVLAAAPAELRQLELLGVGAFVLGRGVIALPTVGALEGDDDACRCHGESSFYSVILVTTPAPTVLPPSRIAKRSPSSHAIGVMSSMSRLMLSPGMTISTPSGSVTSPVTSVVRK